jgi:NAD(P)-dependent dehydrogenase (short-subunit alcohol dehydrogenase family)
MDRVDVGRSRDAVDRASVVDWREPCADAVATSVSKGPFLNYISATPQERFSDWRASSSPVRPTVWAKAAELLIDQGHKVVTHARSDARAEETCRKVGGAEHIVGGDLSSIAETKSVADQVNRLGSFDAVIHNAGIGYRELKLVKTVDDLPRLFAVNSLAPYILTALVTMPQRASIYIFRHALRCRIASRRHDGTVRKPTPKPSFRMCCLRSQVARLFPHVKSNSLEPGWVPTKMGGAGAPDDIDKAHRTQVWLATSDEPAATVSGKYFFHQRLRDADPATKEIERQDLLLDLCRKVSGTPVKMP